MHYTRIRKQRVVDHKDIVYIAVINGADYYWNVKDREFYPVVCCDISRVRPPMGVVFVKPGTLILKPTEGHPLDGLELMFPEWDERSEFHEEWQQAIRGTTG